MTFTDYAAHGLGVLCVVIFAAAGVAALASLARDLINHSDRIAEVWVDLVEAAAARWHAIAALFPVTNAALADTAPSAADPQEPFHG